MARLYISGPVTGIENDNFAAFIDAQERLEAAGYIAKTPHASVPCDATWNLAMCVCINRLTTHYGSRAFFDGVALLPGWEQSEGAKLEKAVAEACGIECRPLEGWL